MRKIREENENKRPTKSDRKSAKVSEDASSSSYRRRRLRERCSHLNDVGWDTVCFSGEVFFVFYKTHVFFNRVS